MSSIDLSSLSVFAATEEQTLEVRKRCSTYWAGSLTQEEYLARRNRLNALDHASDGNLTTWVLASRDNSASLDFRCSCETYRGRAIMKRLDSGKMADVVAYGISAVFTPSEHRRKGYAGHMMSLMHWVLAPRVYLPPFPSSWGTPPPPVSGFNDAQLSVLYSDVGALLYASAGPNKESEGWTVRDAYSTTWVVPNDPSEAHTEYRDDALVKWLDEDACKETWEIDAEIMRASLELPQAVDSASARTVFSFLPTDGVALNHLRRTPCFDAGASFPLTTKWGVLLDISTISNSVVNHSTENDTVFATWAYEPRPSPDTSTLIVTRLRATKETFACLLSCISQAAREHRVERIKIWNLSKELEDILVDNTRFRAKTEERKDQLSCFRWYGPETNGEVHWAFNEKFCWC